MSARRPRVLLVYADRVGRRMGGVGIRATELARALSARADVTVAAAATDGSDLGVPVATFAPHAPRALEAALRGTDAVIAQPQWPAAMRLLERSGARLIFDLYDPEAFGTLEHFAGRRARLRAAMGAFAVDRLEAALRLGHHVVCAGERQRDLWIGALLAARRVTPAVYDRDPSLRDVVDTVPFGIPAAPGAPPTGAPGPRERFGLPADAEIVLWNGGLWSWFDAPTAVRAAALLASRRPRAHLVFMGGSDAAPATRATRQAAALARELGVLDATVHLNDAWVPYEDRLAWLAQAACLVSTHVDHLETRFAYRTRLLDGLWAGVPIVCTRGDELADAVERRGLGETVPPADAGALAGALERVLDAGRDRYAAALASAADDQRWPRVVAPLERWIHAAPPPAAPGRRAALGRAPGELARTAAYRAAVGVMGSLGVGPPSAD